MRASNKSFQLIIDFLPHPATDRAMQPSGTKQPIGGSQVVRLPSNEGPPQPVPRCGRGRDLETMVESLEIDSWLERAFPLHCYGHLLCFPFDARVACFPRSYPCEHRYLPLHGKILF